MPNVVSPLISLTDIFGKKTEMTTDEPVARREPPEDEDDPMATMPPGYPPVPLPGEQECDEPGMPPHENKQKPDVKTAAANYERLLRKN